MTQTDIFAAEYALGLLDGEDLMRARGMLAEDAAFAEAVEKWETHFGPLLDTIPSAQPRPDLWQSIESAISVKETGDRQIIPLRRQVTRWRWATAVASAAAVIALAFLVLPPGTGPIDPAGRVDPGLPLTEPDLVATIPIGDTALSIDLIYQPGARRLYVTSAGLEADGVHDHELWLVPSGGAARSLGVIRPGSTQLVELPLQMAREVGEGSELILTREPLGGAPAGGSAGPIVAAGQFTTI